jgi:NAD-dependent deacetylase
MINYLNKMSQIDEFKNLVRKSNHTVIFTGAGLSTESGIPDFRSSSGLYLTGEFEGYTPEKILSNRFFRVKENQKIFYSFYRKRIMSMRDKLPNRSHYAIQKLESAGKLQKVVNQNIDNLLQTAGVKCVLDLHGNITKFRCTSACGKEPTQKQFMDMSQDTPKCDCGGLIRPCTVLFDEYLPDLEFDSAYFNIKHAYLLIVIGSSLVVQPAAGLIDQLSPHGKLVILNKTKTQYDERADMIFRDSCGEILESVVTGL